MTDNITLKADYLKPICPICDKVMKYDRKTELRIVYVCPECKTQLYVEKVEVKSKGA